jgi:hypothetical protein
VAARGRCHPPYPSSLFTLQFPIEDVREYASRFPVEGEDPGLALGRVARARGYYTLEEFRTICRWKTVRSAPLVARNTARRVKAATAVALRESSSEVERMDALRSLDGVSWPTASVLLHLAYPERYPILDWRALHALGVRDRSSYNQRFWEAYVREYVGLIDLAGVDGRTLDQALWQWSKEQPN